VDDDSTDRTADIVRKFAPRVRLLRKTNGGQASAFNAGIPECQGEIVAFLDGDDWWTPGKLRAVSTALAEDASVGLMGHGITEVYPDGRQHTELLREIPRFRVDSKEGARAFRLRKIFLGTSRMTCRAAILRRIGAVPEALTFEADEYLFTLAGIFADVLILREAFTFYRLHENNAFVLGTASSEAVRRKQLILEAVADALRPQLAKHSVPADVSEIILDALEAEADLLRLIVERGYPWETWRTELRSYRMANENASLRQWLFKCLTLLPACVLPSSFYYQLRRRLAQNSRYRRAREKWLPFATPPHVDRFRTTRP
jgi:glycosyltransferase involved in cell wall biosynthesis